MNQVQKQQTPSSNMPVMQIKSKGTPSTPQGGVLAFLHGIQLAIKWSIGVVLLGIVFIASVVALYFAFRLGMESIDWLNEYLRTH